jgi:glycosyltransferase involved in cell wall biosynthesis
MKKINQKYDFCIVITTYERERMLKELLDDIFLNSEYKIFVVIFDDGSKQSYDLNEYDVKYIKYVKNNGLKNVWKVITDTFNFCKNIDADYYVYLQDDLRLKKDFFKESVRIYEKIPDNNKISLGTLMIESQRNQPKWTHIYPIKFDDYYKTQWCELVFLCKKRFFEELEFKINPIPTNRWDKNPNLSCGVGNQISNRLLKKNLNMYHVIDSLTTHGDHESMFLPELRKSEKLIAK